MNIDQTTPKNLRTRVRHLKKEGYHRVNSISGTDVGNNIEIIYHLSKGEKDVLNLKLKIPKHNAHIHSIQDILPGAVLLERELSEMLGVRVKGNEFERLFLPDNYKGKPPLRKGVKL